MEETKGHEIMRSDSRSEDELKDCLDLFDVSFYYSNAIFISHMCLWLSPSNKFLIGVSGKTVN